MTKAEFIKWLEGYIAQFKDAPKGTWYEGALDTYTLCLYKAKQLEEPK